LHDDLGQGRCLQATCLDIAAGHLPAPTTTRWAAFAPPTGERFFSMKSARGRPAFSRCCCGYWKTLEKLEREHIGATLEYTQFNQSAAARLLGVSRQALIRKIKLRRIELPPRQMKKKGKKKEQ
jgi:DNA-binding NtrC family response regulator